MKIEFDDGRVVEGNTISEVMEKLRRVDAQNPVTVKKYMKIVKERMEPFFDQKVKTDSPENFIYSLKDAGLIKTIEADLVEDE